MKEDTLNKLKAEALTNLQVKQEIGRIENARSRFDTTPRQDKRYAAKLEIYRAEAVKRGILTLHAKCGPEASTINTITWIPVSKELPDDEETVMVALDDGEVWLGFHSETRWSAVDADLFQAEVTHWARMPEGPVTAAHHPV